MEPHSEAQDEFGDLSAEILHLRAALRALEPEDIDKLGDGLRRLRETLAALDERLLVGGPMPSRLWRSTWAQALAAAEAGYREAHAALVADESVEARERCTQAIRAYDKLLAMFPPPTGT
ncbi:MAG: hypothetical protein H6Q89_2804 [Myxococcaceae bacterium]|nr:hypothetical protein [Myxococcaceae bacterium]